MYLFALTASGGRRVVLAWALSAVVFTATSAFAHDPAEDWNPLEPFDPVSTGASAHYHPVLDGYDDIEIISKPEDWRAANDVAEQLDGPRGQLLLPSDPLPMRKKKQ